MIPNYKIYMVVVGVHLQTHCLPWLIWTFVSHLVPNFYQTGGRLFDRLFGYEIGGRLFQTGGRLFRILKFRLVCKLFTEK